jgi:glucose-6-phosphate-specific signal transduction histidine kinase
MTPEQRMTQMEKLLETTIKLTHSNTQKIDANTEAIASLTERVDTVSRQVGELTTMFIDSLGVMRQMQSDIREMQLENRRIIQRFFDEEDLN